MSIPRREVLPNDVEMEILFCGICHSDLHQIKNDFGGTMFPIVPGHEIVGRVTRLGIKVTKFNVGDFAAVGCIVDACGKCEYCKDNLQQFCDESVTYSFNSLDKHLGIATYGGFSESIVTNEDYVLHMPKNLDLAAAAPLLCAGITVYSPLKHWKAGPGKKVGVLGIGGLGHIAIKIAKAMGAHVVVFTTSASKVEDAKRLGADEAVLSSDPAQMQKYSRGLHFILDTVSAKHDVNTYLNLLRHDRPTLPRYQPDAMKANWVMIDTLSAFGNQRGLTPAQVALAWLLALKPFIIPIPGTTKLAHLQENLWSADFEFAPDELKKLTEDLSKIKIVGDRYTGVQAEQIKK